MKTNKYIRALQTSIICIAAAFVLNGCGGKFFTYKGDTVTRKDMKAALQDGKQTGEWKTDELAVKYHYEKASGTIKFSGNVQLIGGMTAFNYIHNLSVYLLFLDAKGAVLDDPLIFLSGNSQNTDSASMAFDKSLVIPQGTTSFSFAYVGAVFNPGMGGQTTYNLNYSPQ